MAKPIEPTPILKGADAVRFVREKERMEKLNPKSEEHRRLVSLGKECLKLYKEKPFTSL